MVSIVDDFEKHCIEVLEMHFGKLASGIVNKVKAKKNLDDMSNINDIKEFIDLIEINISVLAGKNKSSDICNRLRNRALDIMGTQKKIEPLINSDMASEIETFLEKNSLPSEIDVSDYTKYLTLKYGGKAKTVENEIIEKIKSHIKETISRNKIKAEINEFLKRYQQPTKADIDDFINFIRLSKLVFRTDELRDEIEKERLFRKFHGHQEAVKTSDINELVNLLKNTNDKDVIKKNLQNQELSYLIKDESEISDNSLSDFVKTMTPTKEDTIDTLEGLGLTHLISNKRRK
ncbi:MAG: hypothetical protein OIN87_08775 [Candidatus Methanoperedens sp.]|nr:hypothetical protein [Candidatus Methanoperedens sp.]